MSAAQNFLWAQDERHSFVIFSTWTYFPLSFWVFAILAWNYSIVDIILAGFSQIFSLCSKNLENEHSYFSFVSKNECENERIFFCLSADVSAALFLKMSAELSAAHNFCDEREREREREYEREREHEREHERERHFLVSDSYSGNHETIWSIGEISQFIFRYVWPWAKKSSISHDAYTCKNYPNTRGFPTQRKNEPNNFVASVVAENHTLWKICPKACRPRNHLDWTHC